jgi:hypothetical protein
LRVIDSSESNFFDTNIRLIGSHIDLDHTGEDARTLDHQ